MSRPGGGFNIAPEVVLEHDQTDMEETIASMPEELQVQQSRLVAVQLHAMQHYYSRLPAVLEILWCMSV